MYVMQNESSLIATMLETKCVGPWQYEDVQTSHARRTIIHRYRGLKKVRQAFVDSADRWGSTGRQERSERYGNLLTVFDPCGRVQPETDLFEPWRLDGSRLTLMPWQGREGGGEHNKIKMEKKRKHGVRAEGGENIIESQESKWLKKSAARELIGKDKAEVW